jgi:mycothiol synthase
MIELGRVTTDADCETWAAVIEAVEGVRWTLDDMRRYVTREKWLYSLALLDDTPAGALVTGPSDLEGRVFVAIRVVQASRRHGVGTRLLREAVLHARKLARESLTSQVRSADLGSVAFASRFGFEEWLQEVELVRELTGDEREPELPAGMTALPVAARPELLEAAFELCRDGYADLPLGASFEMTRERLLEEEVTGPRIIADLTLVLLDGDLPVAFAGLARLGADAAVAEHGLTTVARERRGQRIGTLLKDVQAARAARAGIRRLVTYTQEGNEAMRTVNERLGYAEQPGWSMIAAPVTTVVEHLGT